MFASKALKALQVKLAAVETQAKKDVQTLKDRAALTEETVKALVVADAPVVAADIAKIAADLANVVARVEALETQAKTEGLKATAAAAEDVTKAASEVKVTEATPKA